MKISMVIPVLNEERSLEKLCEQMHRILSSNGIHDFEVLFVDDGSTDNSWQIINNLVVKYPRFVRGIRFRKNFGKSTALNTGFQRSYGDIVITMDADLQDDPEEIPEFIKKIIEGYDLVSGWKKIRHDPFLKVVSSKFFNFVTGTVSGIKLHDFNCGFKAYSRDLVDKIDLYGELHRYIPILAVGLGYRVIEIPVTHHQRAYGKSKFGVERYIRGFIDLLTVLTITNYNQKPSHLFSGLGVFFGMLGAGALIYLVILWFIGLGPIGNRPLLLFGILAVVLSVQLVSLGVLSELMLQNMRDNSVENFIHETTGFADNKTGEN